MTRLIILTTTLFPLWAMLFSLWAFFMPELFNGFKSAIFPLLAVIMFGMGMTLTLKDFQRVGKQPTLIGLGILLQYLVMPLAAFLIAKLLNLPPALLVGMVLVGSASGGTASNVICYLAKGDVALSISLTLTSTLLAVFAMPLLTELYAGQAVLVQGKAMLLDILKLIVGPVLAGTVLNHFLGKYTKRFLPLFPMISVAAIVIIIAIIVALNHQRMQSIVPPLMLAVVLHNSIGLLLGYWVARRLKYSTKICRTLAIEVGMQNSGMAVALAIKYFSAATALPGALFSIWHNLSGSILAAMWAKQK